MKGRHHYDIRWMLLVLLKWWHLRYLSQVNRLARLMMNNDPKHTSNRVTAWLEDQEINWWKTPAKSPDLNPIENLWHELMEYLRREVKPKRNEELITGLEQFWDTVDIAKCQKYINHLRKVIPKVIEENGGPTGYWFYVACCYCFSLTLMCFQFYQLNSIHVAWLKLTTQLMKIETILPHWA